MDCKICPLDDQFWKKSSFNEEDKKQVVSLYYSHALGLSRFDKPLKLCALTSKDVANIIIDILKNVSCNDILKIIKNDFVPYDIGATDIPQFSDFDDCFQGVTESIVTSGLKDITFEKMGYLLRTVQRNSIADKKYGENHSKSAEILGLTNISKKGATKCINITPVGEVFYSLPQTEQNDLKPKLILYSKMMQNYFVQDESEETLQQMMSVLSESTQKRRRPNVMAFINSVKDKLDEELYGHNI